MRQKITKRFIDGVSPGSKDQYFWDSEIRGFGLRVKPSGRKSYFIQYRNKIGRSRRMTLGQHGRLTPHQARSQARQYLAMVDQGQDPVRERQQNLTAPTVSDLADRYMEQHAKVKKKPSGIKRDGSLLKRLILPKLGKLQVTEVTTGDIAEFHHTQKNKPIQGNRCLALLSKMFSLAETWGLRAANSNPVKPVERYPERKRERYLNPEELARLGHVLMKAEREGTELPSAITAIRLLIFTGCRREEILTLKWEYIDFDLGCLFLPDSKTGQKTVPLGPHALEILQNAARLVGNPFVCYGQKLGKHLVGLPRIWYRLRKEAGLNDVRPHDLRHSFASVAVGAGISLPIIGGLLGHTQPATTARYAHLAQDPAKKAAEEITERISEAMNREPLGTKVVDIKSKRRK
jgi:integrase